MLSDAAVLAASLWLALVLQYGEISFPKDERFDGLYFTLPIIGLAIYWSLGLYLFMLRSMERRVIITIALGAIASSILVAAWAYYDTKMDMPKSVPLVYGLLVVFGVGSVRLFLGELYSRLTNQREDTSRVVIYGAGATGTQLAALLQNAPGYRVVAFVDDDHKLHGAKVRGCGVHSPKKLKYLKERFAFHHILLAMNNNSAIRQRRILEWVTDLDVTIKTMPNFADVIEGISALEKLQPVKIEDLLGRDAVEPLKDLVDQGIQGKNILVTGAAGSIGSEICRLILAAKPAKLIAYDVSEIGLYHLEREFNELNEKSETEVVAKLGSVLDRERVKRMLQENDIHVVYHAAAYKHVPILEKNVLIAIQNNAFGTKTVAEESVAAGVERFVLISTDKAVRPTSIMGASKRLAELVVQDLHTKNSSNTIVSMVRFGNVLGSSGSVIPLFNEQIASGGPLTLTHKEVTRYFMTISEAAQLVVQAGFMATGGEVFVLDMGEPVKLLDLARLMIKLSGKKILESGEAGDGIEITEIGLRPGEKLYEELLIGDNVSGTKHTKIMRAMEGKLSTKELSSLINRLEKAIATADYKTAIKTFEKSVGLGTYPNVPSTQQEIVVEQK